MVYHGLKRKIDGNNGLEDVDGVVLAYNT